MHEAWKTIMTRFGQTLINFMTETICIILLSIVNINRWQTKDSYICSYTQIYRSVHAFMAMHMQRGIYKH